MGLTEAAEPSAIILVAFGMAALLATAGIVAKPATQTHYEAA